MELEIAEALFVSAFGAVLPYACVAAGEWLRDCLVRRH